MQCIKPRRLQRGDTIGIISPASPVAAHCPRRLQRGIDQLRRMGFNVVVGNHARDITGHTAGSIRHRLEDFHDMFGNPNVAAVIATIGGFNSHQLLEDLDFELISRNSKILIGYSDVTALLTAIHFKTNLITFMGPAILPQFGEFGGLLTYTRKRLEAVLMTAEPPGTVPASETWTDERLYWDDQDNRPRYTKPNGGPRVIRAGLADGPLLAANAGTLLLLAGTSYFPDLKGRILCLEDDESETPASIDRYFTQLRHMGVFSEISGLLIGRFDSRVPFRPDDSLDDLLNTATKGYDFPIVADADFGHTDPMMTLPNGVRATLTATEHEAQFTLTEAAVQ